MRISDEKQIRALLLHYGGTEVDEIFDTLQDVGEDKDYRKAVNARKLWWTIPSQRLMPCEKQEVQILRKLNHLARVCRKNSPESAKHVTFEDTAENDEYVYTIGGDKQPNCKVKKTDGNDGQLRRIGRSHGQTYPQGVIQTKGSTSHQAQNFLLRIIHTSKS